MTPNEEIVTGEQGEGAYVEPAAPAASEAAAPAAAAPTPAEVAGEAEKKAAESGEGTPKGEKETPAYTPKLKYKVNGEEKEIPAKYKDLIKSEADEKELSDLFEKAAYKELALPKHEAMQTSFVRLQADHNSMLGHIEEAKAAYQRNDLDAFFEKLAIPQQKVLQYALDKLNYQELPPDQKALIDGRRNTERQLYETQRQQSATERAFQQQAQQAHDLMLNSELARPEVKSMQDALDARLGKGAFLQAVIDRGRLSWFQSSGRNVLTPSQAIEQVIALHGLKSNSPASGNGSANPPASGGGAGKSNTIPNVGSGKSVSPVAKSKVKSIADIKKLHKEMVEREA